MKMLFGWGIEQISVVISSVAAVLAIFAYAWKVWWRVARKIATLADSIKELHDVVQEFIDEEGEVIGLDELTQEKVAEILKEVHEFTESALKLIADP